MIIVNNKEYPIKRYPDGTPMMLDVEANFMIMLDRIDITWIYEPNEEMHFYFLAKHLISNHPNQVHLILPYIPNARMDRTTEYSEVFTLKYFCELINSLGFNSVIVRDAHSIVSLALLDRVVEESIQPLVKKVLDKIQFHDHDSIIFYPDEGAFKRYSSMFGLPFTYGTKTRDWRTGLITGLEVVQNSAVEIENKKVLIIDDICSYGTTFLKSAEKLKELGARDIYLYCTHVENSVLDSKMINSGLIKRIFTTKSIFTKSHPLIEVL